MRSFFICIENINGIIYQLFFSIFTFAKKIIMKNQLSLLFILFSIIISAQVGSVTINVFDEFSKKPLSANVSIQGGKDEIFIGNGSVLIP